MCILLIIIVSMNWKNSGDILMTCYVMNSGNAGERGLIRWRKKLVRRTDQQRDVYDLPCVETSTLPSWCKYVPFLPSFDESLYNLKNLCRRRGGINVTATSDSESTSMNASMNSKERQKHRSQQPGRSGETRHRSQSPKTVSFGLDVPQVTVNT